jgi:hypothetical protein
VSLYWRALKPMTIRYSTSLQLADAFGNRFGQADNYTPGGLPTPFWPAGHYARDTHLISITAGAPPGNYHLHISVYSGEASGPAAPLALASGGRDYDRGSVVTLNAGAPGPAGPLAVLGASLASPKAMVGDRVAFTARWYSGSQPLPPLLARFTLMDGAGKPFFTRDLPPARPDYPTTAWPLDQTILYPLSLILPPDLPAGPAQATLSLVTADGAAAAPVFSLGALAIQAPERSFTVPAIAHRVNYTFNGAIRLLGYDASADTLTLYWQSIRAVDAPLTVFVHRFSADGAFVAGQDSPPARSTTSWLPGEVIVDMHPFAAGDHFEVGLYDPITGKRFGAAFKVGP